jgi:hypothetical protein
LENREIKTGEDRKVQKKDSIFANEQKKKKDKYERQKFNNIIRNRICRTAYGGVHRTEAVQGHQLEMDMGAVPRVD